MVEKKGKSLVDVFADEELLDGSRAVSGPSCWWRAETQDLLRFISTSEVQKRSDGDNRLQKLYWEVIEELRERVKHGCPKKE